MKDKNSTYQVGSLVYDANVYDGLNTDLTDLKFYKKWMPLNKNAHILELCCGTGRLTVPIAKDGFKISGVDNAASMLKKAYEKASKSDLKIEFIEADIRTLELPKKYDLIFIPFNSIHHLHKNEDLFQALNVVKKHLTKDGIFLMDCYNPNIQFITEGEKKEQKMAEYKTKDGRNILINQRMRYEKKNQINRIEWLYHVNGKFDSIQNLDMRLYFPQELDNYLKQNGFTIVHKFGSFEEEEFNDNSDKQIFVCTS